MKVRCQRLHEAFREVRAEAGHHRLHDLHQGGLDLHQLRLQATVDGVLDELDGGVVLLQNGGQAAGEGLLDGAAQGRGESGDAPSEAVDAAVGARVRGGSGQRRGPRHLQLADKDGDRVVLPVDEVVEGPPRARLHQEVRTRRGRGRSRARDVDSRVGVPHLRGHVVGVRGVVRATRGGMDDWVSLYR